MFHPKNAKQIVQMPQLGLSKMGYPQILSVDWSISRLCLAFKEPAIGSLQRQPLASLAAAVMFERFMETGFTEKTNNRFAYEPLWILAPE